MPRTVDFYFDFMSPYAYLAHHRLSGLARSQGWELAYHPIDLAQAKLAVGNTGPANRDMPVKHRYMRIDLKRWADLYGVPFMPPAAYGPERINRGAFYALERGCAQAYVSFVWQRIWGEGAAMDSESLLQEAAGAMGWDAEEFIAYTGSDEAARRLRASNEAATQRGVFGVPTMAIGTDMWWGNDRLDFVAAHMTLASANATETQ